MTTKTTRLKISHSNLASLLSFLNHILYAEPNFLYFGLQTDELKKAVLAEITTQLAKKLPEQRPSYSFTLKDYQVFALHQVSHLAGTYLETVIYQLYDNIKKQ